MSTDPSSSALADRASRPGPALGVIVALACVGQFMVTLDVAIVNAALPAMRAGLGMSANGQQWVVDGYLVTFGGFTLLAARAGDLLGRKRVFQAGLAAGPPILGGMSSPLSWRLIPRPRGRAPPGRRSAMSQATG